MSKKNEKGRRFRDAREDATVGSIEKHIEGAYGLPKGSIQINRVDDKNARSDKTIKNLRKEYGVK